MIYKKVTALALGAILGIIASLYSTIPLAITVLLLLVGVALTLFVASKESRWKELPLVLSLAAMLMIGISCGYLRVKLAEQSYSEESVRYQLQSAKNQKYFKLRGKIDAEPELRHNSVDLVLKVDQIYSKKKKKWQKLKSANVFVKLRMSRKMAGDKAEEELYYELAESTAYGFYIEIDAKRKYIPKPKNLNEFNYRDYFTQNSFVDGFDVYTERVTILDRASGSLFHELAFAVKMSFLKTYKQTIKSPASRLISGATLGTRRALDKVYFNSREIPETFRRAGVGHVLAVSGLHVSIVSLLLYSIFVMVGFKPKYFAPAIILLLILFTLLTGARPSTVRAAVMNSVTLIAFAYFRYNLRHATFIGLSISSLFILMGNPSVLYSASFLLSFGAVLSLVLLAPTFSKWMNALRGFTLIFVVLYIAGIIAIANYRLELLLQLENIVLALTFLWMLTRMGRILNNRLPAMWKLAYESLPFAVRSLIVAQFAIQFGMMVPLNAWFFGQFPVAGVAVNLLAIPLIGVIVQLGILTGILGAIPVIGIYLAMPIGAFSNMLGMIFLRIADYGAASFSYPATPRPTLLWMALYYLILALLLFYDKAIEKVQYFTFLLNRRWRNSVVRFAPALLALISLVLPLIIKALPEKEQNTILVYHTRKEPVVSVSLSHNRAAVFNSENSYFTSRTLFGGLRQLLSTNIECFVLPDQRDEKFRSVFDFDREKMNVNRVLLPKALPENGLTPSGEGLPEFLRVNFFNISSKVSFEYLFSEGEESVSSYPVSFTVQNRNVLLIPDFGSKVLLQASYELPKHYDLLIVPHINTDEEYLYVQQLAARVKPALLIVANGGRRKTKNSLYALPGKSGKKFPVILTNRDGAVIIRIEEGHCKLRTIVSEKEYSL